MYTSGVKQKAATAGCGRRALAAGATRGAIYRGARRPLAPTPVGCGRSKRDENFCADPHWGSLRGNTVTGRETPLRRPEPGSRRRGRPDGHGSQLAFTDSYRRQSVAACGGGGREGHAVRRRGIGAGRAWRAPARHCGAGVRGARRTPLTRAPPAPAAAARARPHRPHRRAPRRRLQPRAACTGPGPSSPNPTTHLVTFLKNYSE